MLLAVVIVVGTAAWLFLYEPQMRPCAVVLRGNPDDAGFARCFEEPFASSEFPACERPATEGALDTLRAKSRCLATLAEEFRNPALCDRAMLVYGWCAELLDARMAREPCETITSPRWHDACIYRRAQRTNDPNECLAILDPVNRDTCLDDLADALLNQCARDGNCTTRQAQDAYERICTLIGNLYQREACDGVTELSGFTKGVAP